MLPSDVLDRLRRVAAHALLSAPTPLFAAVVPKVERDGRTLDPQFAAALAGAALLHIPGPHELGSIRAGRAHAARTFEVFDAAPRAMAQVIDTSAAGPGGPIPIRIYRPRGAAPALILYFHGGGGVIGSVASYDATVRLLADQTRCVIASVGYRLGPEHPHPAAIDDALAAWTWAQAQARALEVAPDRLGVAGDSFGGFLAAILALRAPRKPRHLALIYPAVDLTHSMPSHATFADGFLLTRAMIDWFTSNYCPDPAQQRAASPLFAPDLAGAPPTTVITAGFDPLRDEGLAWAERLRAAGGQVTYRCHDELVHGFVQMTSFRAAAAAVDELCADLRAGLLP